MLEWAAVPKPGGRTLMSRTLVVGLMILLAASWAAGENLVKNGQFAQKTDAGLPVAWSGGRGQEISIVDNEAPEGLGQSLRVQVVTDGGTTYGEFGQLVKAKPDTLYRLEGKTQSTKPGMAFFSVKLRKDGRELQRIGMAKSQARWTPTSHEFTTGDADEIQVLCRWEQNAQRGWVGETAWFADVRLTEIGKAPPPPPWTQAIRRAAGVEPVAAPPLPLKASDADIYVTPGGAGRRDGTAWDHALPGNASGVLQAAWDALAPGQTCRLGSGVYAKAVLAASTGGTGPDRMKRLAGEDTGGGLPWLVGDWTPSDPAKGLTLINLTNEVDYCAFENLRVARYQHGVFSRKGRHQGLRIRNLGVYEMRDGVYLNGFAYADEPAVASHDIEVRDCEFIHFTKNAVRFQAGNHDVRVINCLADAGGPEWMKEAFHICFPVEGDAPRRLFDKDAKPWASDHDILFIGCTARNAYFSKAKFWQGDGYTAEGGVHDVAYINCAAYDNADGGWDVKGDNVIFVNCVGLRNKINWRLWKTTRFLDNCLSAYSFKRGGSWITAGLWTVGEVHARRCTFYDNTMQQIAADKQEDSEARVTLERCLVSFDDANTQAAGFYSAQTRVAKSETVEWQPKATPDADPQYVGAAKSRDWMGQPPDAFDSRRYGPAKGFHSSVYTAWRSKTPDELVEAARLLLKQKGWEDFKTSVEAMTGPKSP
jgi:hypothetical protein